MAGQQGTEYSFVGNGSTMLRVKNAAMGLVPVGNVSALTIQTQEDVKELRDYQNPGGGMANSIRRITGVKTNMTMRDFIGTNVGRALFGSSTALAAGTVTDEPVTLYAGSLTPLAKINPSAVTVASADGTDAAARVNTTAYLVGDFYVPAVANGHYYMVTVAGTSAASAPTFTTDGTTFADGTATVRDMGLIAYPTDGSYYDVTPAGLWVPAAATFAQISASNGIDALVDYSYSAQNVVQALVNSGLEYELLHMGLNEAQSGKPVIVRMHRVRFGPAAELGLISDDYGEIALNGDVLKDSTITGAGLSQYLTWTYVE